jgi:hypothetical protein
LFKQLLINELQAKVRKDKASRTGSPVLRKDGENLGQ